jgi:hypothetical protein
MTPEYLIASFLLAGRDKDIAKIKLLLEQAPIDHEKLTGILSLYNLLEKFHNLRDEKK